MKRITIYFVNKSHIDILTMQRPIQTTLTLTVLCAGGSTLRVMLANTLYWEERDA